MSRDVLAFSAWGIAATLALSACGEGGSDQGESTTGPVITPSRSWNSLPDAGINAKLVEKNGCLFLDGSAVFWPHGTTWDPKQHAVVFEDGSRAAVGAKFTGAGGGYPADTDFADLLDSKDAAERLERCIDASVWSSATVASP